MPTKIYANISIAPGNESGLTLMMQSTRADLADSSTARSTAQMHQLSGNIIIPHYRSLQRTWHTALTTIRRQSRLYQVPRTTEDNVTPVISIVYEVAVQQHISTRGKYLMQQWNACWSAEMV